MTMQIFKYTFSIFTPTYNRGHCIKNVYNSLLNQTYKNFEWIIVNDGSNDDTDLLVQEFLKENKLTIKYLKQSNKGKHIAQNRAVGCAEEELFLPLDSDDTIVENALEILWQTWNLIDKHQRVKYSGIGVHCMNKSGQIIGDLWPENQFDSNDLEIHFVHKVRGEKWGPIRTDVMKEYLNAEVKGHFLSESTMWFRIANKYKKRYINIPLRIYEIHDDSLSVKRKVKIDHNAESKLHANLIYINEFWNWYIKYDLKTGIIICLSAIKASCNCKKTILFGDESLIHNVKPITAKILIFMASPVKFIIKIRCVR